MPSVPSALSSEQGPAAPTGVAEPVLDIHDIQGNVLVGFHQDFQSFVFFAIADVAAAKAWLRRITPRIATVEETLAARRLFRALRARRAEEAAGMASTWVNIAFTASGLAKLTSPETVDKFPSAAFKVGMAGRAGLLGDPVDAAGEPVGWTVGAGDRRPDVLVIVASDTREGLTTELARLAEESAGGLRRLHEDHGENLPGELAGHEHFGFKDGVSQPGVRGRVSAAARDFLTPRLIDAADPRAATHARPGQPLVWPGQFVLGAAYPAQDALDALRPGRPATPEPAWAANGSFLVYRRLRQDVAAFWRFAHAQAAALAARYPSLAGLTAQRFASLLVGRWPSGAPVMRTPLTDDSRLAAHPLAANHFGFSEASVAVPLIDGTGTPDTFAQAPGDRDGLRCPFASHIRKVNPRDDSTELGGSERSLPKRILRRGIPFGTPLADPLQPGLDDGDRGLLFVSYQASIDEQFEFLMTDWADSIANPRSYSDAAGEHAAGHDLLIGQQPAGDRARVFAFPVSDGQIQDVAVRAEWVTTTGGDYFFAPSISALQTVLSG